MSQETTALQDHDITVSDIGVGIFELAIASDREESLVDIEHVLDAALYSEIQECCVAIELWDVHHRME